MSEAKFSVASVHGRFQPLHNGHLEYLLAAKARCDLLWIGLTKFEPEQLNPLGRHRERPDANPLTYFERMELTREALTDAGVSQAEFFFVPFPIEHPASLHHFLPTSIPCLTTICEAWNREKVAVLREHGYSVIVLWEREPKEISGSEIRRQIVLGDDSYKTSVPPATARAVERLGIRQRLVALSSPSI